MKEVASDSWEATFVTFPCVVVQYNCLGIVSIGQCKCENQALALTLHCRTPKIKTWCPSTFFVPYCSKMLSKNAVSAPLTLLRKASCKSCLIAPAKHKSLAGKWKGKCAATGVALLVSGVRVAPYTGPNWTKPSVDIRFYATKAHRTYVARSDSMSPFLCLLLYFSMFLFPRYLVNSLHTRIA